MVFNERFEFLFAVAPEMVTIVIILVPKRRECGHRNEDRAFFLQHSHNLSHSTAVIEVFKNIHAGHNVGSLIRVWYRFRGGLHELIEALLMCVGERMRRDVEPVYRPRMPPKRGKV